jgi:hypothetical protein
VVGLLHDLVARKPRCAFDQDSARAVAGHVGDRCGEAQRGVHPTAALRAARQYKRPGATFPEPKTRRSMDRDQIEAVLDKHLGRFFEGVDNSEGCPIRTIDDEGALAIEHPNFHASYLLCTEV